MAKEATRFGESQELGVEMDLKDPVNWAVRLRLEKREGDWTSEQIDAGLAPEPYTVVEKEGNLLMTAGANHLFKALRGDSLTAFNNANARLGVGDSSTAAAANQTDLQAATNKLRKGMDTGYPQVGIADGLDADNKIAFRATFGTSEANFAWNEWAVFNHATAGVMLNRKVESLGTKSTGSWTLTVTCAVS